MTVNARVQAGARFLDENGPVEWRSKIDMQTLNLRSSYNCVLAQLGNASFFTVSSQMNLRAEDCIALGFEIADDDIDEDGNDPYDELHDAWVDVLVQAR